MTAQDKITGIRKQLDAIAPLPEDGPVTAAMLSRHFAVRAQERWTRQMSGLGEIDHGQLSTACAEFAASRAMSAFALWQPSAADNVAADIRDALEDGGSIGEWLWAHLRDGTGDQVAVLAEELAAAQAALAAEAVSADA